MSTSSAPVGDHELLVTLCKPAQRPTPAALAAFVAAVDELGGYLEPAGLEAAGWLLAVAAPGAVRRPAAWPEAKAASRPTDEVLLELLADLALEASWHWPAIAWLYQTAAPEVCDAMARHGLVADTDHLVTAWLAVRSADEILADPGYVENPFRLAEDEMILIGAGNVLRSRLARGDGDAATIRAVLSKIDRIVAFTRRYVDLLRTPSPGPTRRLATMPPLLEAAAACLAFGVDVRRLVESIEGNFAAHDDSEDPFDYLGRLASAWRVVARHGEAGFGIGVGASRGGVEIVLAT